jgi:predicted nucleotidyltransferase component of viral defense system
MSMSIEPIPSSVFKLIKDEFNVDPVFIEKDWYTQHILGVIAKFESDEFQPVFSGGTSLSKGYQLIQRFSEDVDFRMRPLQEKLTRSFRSNYQDRIVQAVLDSSPDLQLVRDVYKRDKSTFLKFQVAYPSQFSSVDALRPYVQVELSFEPPQLETETCPISSLVHQFTQQPPEILGMACLNLSETAADKLSALSWRVMGKEPSDEKYDPRIIRHLYDLSYLAPRVIDSPDWLNLSYKTVANDLKTRDRGLAERIKDPMELLTQLTKKLGTNRLYARHYQDFVESLTYGQSPSFNEAVKSLTQLTNQLCCTRINLVPKDHTLLEPPESGITLQQLINLKNFYQDCPQGKAQSQSKEALKTFNQYKFQLLQAGKISSGDENLKLQDKFFEIFRSDGVDLSPADKANLPAADEFASAQTLNPDTPKKRNRSL